MPAEACQYQGMTMGEHPLQRRIPQLTVHSSVFVALPAQFKPPLAGAGLVHVRV
jgi:hypothetical protein